MVCSHNVEQAMRFNEKHLKDNQTFLAGGIKKVA